MPVQEASPEGSAVVIRENDGVLNREALRWLKKAKEPPEPHLLHVLTLAFWGLEAGAEGD
jgi:hypothetical protein